MTAMTATISGDKRLRRKLAKLPKAYRHALKQAANRTAMNIRDDAKESIKDFSGSYREYIIGNGKSHFSSPPGMPPNEITGFLRRSIKVTERATISNITIGVSVNAYYGLFLELGTRQMDARPFLGPAYRRHSPGFTKVAKALVQAAGKEVAGS